MVFKKLSLIGILLSFCIIEISALDRPFGLEIANNNITHPSN